MANDPAEAVYLMNFTDDSGAKFAGDGRYELQFTGDNLPPVDAFWSLTMYAADYNLVANPAHRYSIGDRTPGVTKDADGGITPYIQFWWPPCACRSDHFEGLASPHDISPGKVTCPS
ncbi:MAG: DUF1214 domain-containing protein [Streptosporangiaceae bacterium]